MGNSPAHDFMAEAVWHYPGLVVLHDLSLHYFFSRQPIGRYLRAFGYSASLAGTALARRFLREFVPVDYPEYLVCEWLVDRSPGVIVHSRHGLDLFECALPDRAAGDVTRRCRFRCRRIDLVRRRARMRLGR